ncbi:hypothetical protein M8818_006536 [Zalaria obscura]|uniref:Uncharacterized protein n=1 Tax=Zalaria obscura TaxID=2024903 RepID=A0ACC3S6Z5_9PEZI
MENHESRDATPDLEKNLVWDDSNGPTRRPSMESLHQEKDDAQSTISHHTLSSLHAAKTRSATSSPLSLQRGTTREQDHSNYIPGISSDNPNIVVWDGPDDPANPRNWPFTRKLLYTIVAGSMVFAVSFSSSVFAPAITSTAEIYGVSTYVTSLAISLHILGFAAGPCLFGPMSEVFGRTIPMWIGLCGLGIFQIPQALAGNLRTILVCRFFEGMFGSGVFAVVSGMIIDVWDPIIRGVPLAWSATGINLGATVAPVVGGFVVATVGWRWTAWVTGILVLVLAICGIFTIRESFEPVLLARKAKRMRFATQNWSLHAASEEIPFDAHLLVQKYLTKPIRMFFQEPILIIISTYLTLVYGILYLAYQAFPFSFERRGWAFDIAYLPFLSLILGIISAWAVFSLYTLTAYKKRFLARGGSVPEDRLPPMIFGAAVLPPALWWFAWSTHTHWVSQVIAGYFIGLGLLLVFICGIVYVVDVYHQHANSAVSIHVVMRSVVSCSFPLFATPMFESLGTDWACTLLGFVCLLMVPAPVVFLRYGKDIRKWSRFAE